MLFSKKIIQAPENTFALVGDSLPVRVLAYVHEELIFDPQEGDEFAETAEENTWITDQFGETHLDWYPIGKGLSRAELKKIEEKYEEYRLEGLAATDWKKREDACKLPFKKYCELIGFEAEKYLYD